MSMRAGALIALGLTLLAATLAPKRPVLAWNASASVPVGLYLIASRPVHIGDYVLIRLSDITQALAVRHGYIGANTPLLKRVAAREGDRVCRSGRAAWIAGRQVVIAFGTDRVGKPLPVWQGCYQLQDGQLFVLGTHSESFDSRYFGPIDRDQVIGVATPLLLVGP